MRRPCTSALRVLRLYDTRGGAAPPAAGPDRVADGRVHARSRFRSVADGARIALYAVQDADAVVGLDPADGEPAAAPWGQHTLLAVRELRRVPMDAAPLALAVFTARPEQAGPVAETLAVLIERAVDLHRPGYLLLARSLEDPRTSLLLVGGAPDAAILDGVCREVQPMLAEAPERYVYCPASAAAPAPV